MSSNYINATEAKINNLSSASHSTPVPEGATLERVLRQFDYDRVEELLRPYIVDLSQQLPDIDPLISINGSCICSRGNISAICGEAKSRKTFLTSALVASALAIPYKGLNNFKFVANNSELTCLWVDTEQGQPHVRKVIERISEMTGSKLGGLLSEPRLTTLSLREEAPAKRKELFIEALYHFPYDLVVIDGIADLQRNTNDLEESDALVSELMALSTKTNTHIICVLHTNPGTDKARGHLGSSLQRKAESVIYVHRNGDSSIVEPQFCRNEPFERFAFTIDDKGIPVICDLPAEPLKEDVVADIVREEYGGVVERKVLTNKLITSLSLVDGAARMRITRAIKRGALIADGDYLRLPDSVASAAAPAVEVAPAVEACTSRYDDDDPPF